MTIKNPALLKTREGGSFLDYWFAKAGRGEGCEDRMDGSFRVRVILHVSAIVEFPKSLRGLCGIIDEFRGVDSNRPLYQVGLRDLAEYVHKHDEHSKINVEGLPYNVLAKDWEKCAAEILES